MADQNKFVQAPKMYLSGSGVSSTATSIQVTSLVKPGTTTTIAMTDFGNTGYATLEPGTSREENISFTGITQNGDGTATFTGVTRGLDFVSPYSSTAALKHAHAGGTDLIISNSAPFFNEIAAKDNDETVTGTWTFDADAYPKVDDASTPPTDDAEFATKKYADALAIAGAPDATATVKGLVEVAAASEAAAGAAAGSGDTSAALAITTAITSNTSSAAQLIPVTDADGDIPVEFMELDADWAFTGNNSFAGTHNISTATNWQLGGVAFTGTMADLNEAEVFFGATDITGAEAETLTDGSITHKHSHRIFEIVEDEMNEGSYVTIVGDNFEGFTETTTATATINRNVMFTELSVTATGDDAILGLPLGAAGGTSNDITWNSTATELVFNIKFSTNTTRDAFIGLHSSVIAAVPASATDTTRHAGFFITGTTIYASQADGTTQEKTDVSAGITLSNRNTYKVVLTAGVDTKFYINNTLVATLNTNQPTGTGVEYMVIGNTCTTGGSGNYEFIVYNNWISRLTI